MLSRRVKGKVIIVTGCNSPIGIGRATVHQFAHNGAKAIFVCDYNTQHLETHKRELNSLYPDVDVHPRQMDAGEEADVERIVNEALEKYGRLDVFFANAGISISAERVTDASAEKFMQVMKTNSLRQEMLCLRSMRTLLTSVQRLSGNEARREGHAPNIQG